MDKTIGFWIAAAVMTALVALVLSQALRRGSRQAVAAPGAEDVGIYRDQLAEVERDLARGTLPAAEAGRLKAEISRRLLAADARTASVAAAGTARAQVAAGLALVALALVGGVALYARLGAPGYPDLPLTERLALAQAAYEGRPSQATAEAAAPKLDAPSDVDPQLTALIGQLRAVVKDRPDDPKGLAFLARYEAALGNFPDAIAAQSHMIAVKGPEATADDHASLAELMIMAAGGQVSPEAEQQLVAALTLDPADAPSRYYSGLMFLQTGRPDRTFDLWEPLLRESAPDAPWSLPIRDQIEQVAQAAGIRYALPVQKGPSEEDMSAAAQMAPEDRQAMIANMVGGLEARLMDAGGPIEDWTKLVGALGVLGQTERAQAAYDAARTAFAADPGALSALQAAADTAGIAP
jgi:cytochrome c-type biogenesis protein CcmH